MTANCFQNNKVGVSPVAVYGLDNSPLLARNYNDPSPQNSTGIVNQKCPFVSRFATGTAYQSNSPDCTGFDASQCFAHLLGMPTGSPTPAPTRTPSSSPSSTPSHFPSSSPSVSFSPTISPQPTTFTDPPTPAPTVESSSALPSFSTTAGLLMGSSLLLALLLPFLTANGI